jgi:alpha-L-fucosidase
MADATWFDDAKFGLFIHFGLYSIPGGVWKGRVMGRNHYAEWIRMQDGWPDQLGIPRAEYDTLLAKFNPIALDVDAICREAAAAGMRYFVLTTKHHDGFALWPSKIGDYSVRSTPCRRDLVGEFTEAGRRHGLKVGFYYSHWLDWAYPGGGLPPWPEREGDPPVHQPGDNAYEAYWLGKCLPQVSELIDLYSPDLFWFDSWGDRREGQLTADRLSRLIELVRQKSPHTLINSRIGTEAGVDFLSTMDNEFPTTRIRRLWETSATMNRSWGYSSLDHEFRPTEELLRALIDNASRGGNLQLNIGPRGDGSLQPAVLRRLRDLASWMSVNADAIHGTRPVDATEPAWGRLLQKGDRCFAFVYDWPTAGRLVLPRLAKSLQQAVVVETGASFNVKTEASGQAILLGHSAPDSRVSVLELS